MLNIQYWCVSGFLLGGFFFLGCTATIPTVPVNGEIGGQRIATTVDSELARYYLEEYLAGNRTNPDLDEIILTVENKKHENSKFYPEFLKDISGRLSVDFATLYLANHILNDELNQPVQSLFDNQSAMISWAGAIEQFTSDPAYTAYVLLFVPGWFYKTDPWTGADLAKQRAVATRLGLEHYLVDIEDNGTIETNASIIATEIAHYARENKQIILVSVSKAGPEVALALGEVMDEAQTHTVKAWINIGGLLQGSLIADSALRWPKRWFAKLYFHYRGWSFDSVEGMATETSRARFNRLCIPRHILIINYIGIPLSGDVSILARDRYLDLRQAGPNDGLTLITHGIVPNRMTIAQLGVDHFFMDPEIDIKTVAMIRTVIKLIEMDTYQQNLHRPGTHDRALIQ